MKKALSIFLAVVVVLSSFAVASFAAETYSGKCGENLIWSLDTATGELVISGTGAMYDWSDDDISPWYYRGEYIKSVTINEGVTTIGAYAFYNRDNITSVSIPDTVTSISDKSFSYCDGLTSIVIPDSVEKIGKSVFASCINLVTVKIGNGVTSIGSGAFLYCNALKNITIPDSVTTIRNSVFSLCGALTSIAIPDSVTTIDTQTFYSCKNLARISIGSGITAIRSEAFYNATAITDIYYRGSQAEWDEIAFGSGNDPLFNATMHFNHIHGSSVSEVTPPTCTEQGYTTHTCECGYSYVGDYVEATGHEFLDGKCRCGEVPEKLSSIQEITYVQQESTRKTFTVTCNGRASMIQFVEPDGGTRTYDRYNKNVTITGYNADGEVVNSMSRDLAYEVWEIYTNLSVGTTVKLRAKFNSKWEEDKRTLLVDEYNPVVSMELASYSGKKGAVMATVVADEKTEKVMFKMSDGSSVTVAPSGKDENGNNIFTGKAWMNEDGLNVINVLIRRKNMWKQVGVLEYTVE